MTGAAGLDGSLPHFLDHHLPYLHTLPTAVIGNIAGKPEDEFVGMASSAGPCRHALFAAVATDPGDPLVPTAAMLAEVDAYWTLSIFLKSVFSFATASVSLCVLPHALSHMESPP
ncbi:hypothetical protein J0H58_30900 [bacterium]|nr:hypothetical protein [bacterium]